jgi:catechol 2,3-dioxygenase-like lactoylglutathione lyase family enzyme
MKMKLGKLMIFVTDFEVAKKFYSDLLGLRLVSEEENELIFANESYELVAYKCEKTSPVGDYSNEARAVFVFEVESIDIAFEEMKSKGIRFLHKIPNQNKKSRYAAFVDPFGIVHEICENLHFD